jgi:hypothetical protein
LPAGQKRRQRPDLSAMDIGAAPGQGGAPDGEADGTEGDQGGGSDGGQGSAAGASDAAVDHPWRSLAPGSGNAGSASGMSMEG